MDAIRLLIADDDVGIIDGLVKILSLEPGVDIVGIANDAQEAIRLAVELQPEVALVDINMPGGGGPVAAAGIRESSPSTHVIAHSMYDDRGAVMQMVRAGSIGYIVKGSRREQIVGALDRARRGEAILSDQVASLVVNELSAHLRDREQEAERYRQDLASVRRLAAGAGLELRFEPIVDLVLDTLSGFEALPLHPAGGGRDDFGSLAATAARVGFSSELELGVARLCLERVDQLPPGTWIGINVSPASLLDPALAESVLDRPQGLVCLELSGQPVATDYVDLRKALDGMRGSGVKVAVDGVGGTGASLRHLVELRPDLVKLDPWIIERDDPDSTLPLVEAIVRMLDNSGSPLVACGVRGEADMTALRDVGVRFAQGPNVAPQGGRAGCPAGGPGRVPDTRSPMNLLRDLLGRARREADLMPAPMRREGIAFRFAPLLVVGLFTALLQFGPSPELITRYQLATVGLVVVLIASVFLAPWHRLPRWSQGVPPLLGIVLYLSVIGSPDYRITYSPVLLVPILWLALYYTWVELTVGLALVLGFSLLQAFVARVPVAELMLQACYAAVSALAFYSVHIVVQRIRNYAIDVTIVGRLLNEVASVTDSQEARVAICNGVNRVCWAGQARLYELDPERGLLATAGSPFADITGLPLPDTPAGPEGPIRPALAHPAVRAFLSGQPVFTREAAEGSQEWLGGTQRSALWHPVLRNGEPVGVLAASWSWRVHGIASREAASMSIFASEAAMIIERADLVRQLSVMVRTDPVTELANRRAWDAEIPLAMARAVRAGEPLCVAVIDLDHFKAYNDDWGHDRGDRLLHDVASAWRVQLREVDLLARFGGDEFALLLPNCPQEEAVRVVERLSQAAPEGQRCSAGVAWWDGGETADEVLARADAALYESKRAERGTVTTSGAMDNEPGLKHWTMLVPELLRSRAMTAVYQPICLLDSRQPIGYESLARPAGEDPSLSVEALFAAAHRMGAWRDLDWLCRRAAVENAGWLPPDQLLFVNVGVRALLDPVHDTDQMLMLMRYAGRSPATVVLEISEREPVSDLRRFRSVIASYRREGFRFALDDVGEGHSTLETMAAANPEFIKVARSLTIQSMIGAHRAVIRALVEFGRSNGAQVIAEGIETEAQLESVRELGAELGQGFALGRPAAMGIQEATPVLDATAGQGSV